MENTAWHFSDFKFKSSSHNNIAYLKSNYSPHNQNGFADYPNGQLRITVLDLGNFMIAFLNGGNLNNNSILSSNTVDNMLSLQIPSLDTVQMLNWYRTILTTVAEKQCFGT